MKTKNWSQLAAMIFCLGFFCLPAHAVKTGDAAPNFSAKGADGKTYSLGEFKGKKIVVLEWMNHGCPFVKKHYNPDHRNMQKLQEKYAKNPDVVWFSIVSSAEGKQGFVSAADAQKELKEYGAAPTAVLLDAKGEVGKLFDAKTTPHMFVIGKDGKVVYQGAIDDKPTTETADIDGAKNYVATALDHLLDPELAKTPLAVSTTKPYGCSVKY